MSSHTHQASEHADPKPSSAQSKRIKQTKNKPAKAILTMDNVRPNASYRIKHNIDPEQFPLGGSKGLTTKAPSAEDMSTFFTPNRTSSAAKPRSKSHKSRAASSRPDSDELPLMSGRYMRRM